MSKKNRTVVPQRVQTAMDERVRKARQTGRKEGRRTGRIEREKELMIYIEERPFWERLKYVFSKEL